MKTLFSILFVFLTLLNSGCFSCKFADRRYGDEALRFTPKALMAKDNSTYIVSGECQLFRNESLPNLKRDLGKPYPAYIVVDEAKLTYHLGGPRSKWKISHFDCARMAARETFMADGYFPIRKLPNGYFVLKEIPPNSHDVEEKNIRNVSYFNKPGNLFWTVPVDVVTSPIQIVSVAFSWLFISLFWSGC